MVPFAALVAIAGGMTGVLIWLIRRYPSTTTLVQVELLTFVLVMMATMFLGAGAYISSPGEVTLAYAVGGNMFAMVIGLVIILNSFSEEAEERRFNRKKWTPVFSILLIFNEALMGFVFHEAQSGLSLDSSALGASVGTVNAAVNTYWFFTPMMAEMVSAITLVKNRSKGLNGVYVGLVGATAFPPTLIDSKSWVPIGFALTLAALAYSLVLSRGARGKQERFGVAMVVLLILTMVASYLTGGWVVFAAGILVAMYWFYNDAFARKVVLPTQSDSKSATK